MRPLGFFHREPVTVRLQTPLEHEFRFVLLGGNQPDYIFVQPGRRRVRLEVGVEAVLVLLLNQAFNGFGCCAHDSKTFRARTSGRWSAQTLSCRVIFGRSSKAGKARARSLHNAARRSLQAAASRVRRANQYRTRRRNCRNKNDHGPAYWGKTALPRVRRSPGAPSRT